MAQHSKYAWSGIGYSNGPIEVAGGIAQVVASQVNAQSALTALVSLLLSQAALPGGAMPFAVPLAAALLLLQKPMLPALIGCSLGLLLRWEPITWVNGWQLLAIAMLSVTVRTGWNWRPWKVAVATGAAMLLPFPFAARRADMLIVCLSGAAVAGILTPVYVRSLLALSAPRHALSNDDKLCCLLVAAAMALGGMWMRFEVFMLGEALAAASIFAIAWAAGPGLALPAGVLMGLALMLSGASFDTVMLLAVLGGLSGALGGGKRFMPLIGGVVGCALVAFAQGGMDWIIASMPSLALGGVIFAALPLKWLEAMRAVIEMEAPVQEPDAVASSYILAAHAEAMANMATALPVTEQASDMQPVELLACRLCTGCAQQNACWDERRDQTMELLDGILLACAGNADALDMEQAARVYGCTRAEEVYALSSALVASRMRKEKEDARRMEARAWALEQLSGQARALQALSDHIGEDCTIAGRARAAICAAMPALRGRPDSLTVCTLEGKLHVWLNVHSTEGQVERLEAALSAAVGRSMELLDPQVRHEAMLFTERPRLKLVVGRAGVPIAGEDISGDSVLSERLGAGRHVLAISDGMGSGRAARAESRAALKLLHQALRAGYGRGDALRTVNGLLVACRGDEMFATMDLCVVDLDSGEAALEKLGACPSFLLRAGKCKRIGGDALPLGILDAVRPRTLTTRMQVGDLLLMVSDGVFDAFGSEEASLLRALGGLASGDHMPTPQRFADTLLRRAYERGGGKALDDMTVLAVKLEEAS
ncbi:MAG: SpoIIE family protein phosphatase [Firmicutes bacterium]|nr:SpoIIE family protein phosphatase [Bacillota bacterium]